MSRILPVSFSLPLVRRIRSGDKVETRRPVSDADKRWPNATLDKATVSKTGDYLCIPDGTAVVIVPSPIKVGDLLYVRETARVLDYPNHGLAHIRYEADGAEAVVSIPERIKFTPIGQCLANGAYREACRTWLEVAAVRVERLHEIDEASAKAEGMFAPPCIIDCPRACEDCPRHCAHPLTRAFRKAWDTFYTGPKSWEANPFVWVYSFRMVDAPSSL